MLVLSSVALAAVLAGCGSGSGGSTSASPTANEHDQGVKFAQCMRKHGIQMDDPKPGKGVEIRVRSEDEAKMKAATKACQAYAPERDSKGTMSAEDLDRMTKLAQCLRRNGMDVADPKPGQPFTIKTKKENAAKSDQAMKTCNKELGMPEPEKGGGPGTSRSGSSGSTGSGS